MAIAFQKTFFYSASLVGSAITQLVQGIVAPPADTIEFTDVNGGDAARELAIPLLRGMDEIQVLEAEIRIRARALEVETHAYAAVNSPDGKGVFLSLAKPGLLKKVTLQSTKPISPAGKTVRLVVRTAEPQGGGFKGGVPLFAEPGMKPLGPMYGPALPGFALTGVSGGNLATLPGVMGSVWLIQWAEGDEPDKLDPLPAPISIVSVVLDGLPADVTVSLVSPDGDLVLWNNPGILLSSSGEQVVSFTPLAQRHLAEKLKTAGDAALPVSLKFHSTSAGALDIPAKSLRAQYVARPFGAEPRKLRLPGDRVAMVFDVPAGLTPIGNSLRLTVRPDGRARDAASPESPDEVPVQGLQVTQSVYAAACLPVAAAGPITGVRVLLRALDASEGVLEARADIAGAPGEALGKPSVRQFAPGAPAWTDFDFPQPIVADTPNLWLTLRTNQGTLLWFTDDSAAGGPKLSLDQGKSWSIPDTPLGPAQMLLAQLVTPSAASLAPVVKLQEGLTVRAANLLAGADAKAGDFSVTTSLPSNLLAAPPAEGSVQKRFDLVSATIADVIIEDFVITYDPAA